MNNVTFEGKNYSVVSESEQFTLIHPVSENETFDTFDELVESHPICEESREFFFGNDQYLVITNQYSGSGKWEIHADDQGTRIGTYDSPDDVRSHLCELGLFKVSIDADGNGSIVEIPIEWIGDGDSLVGSERVLALI